jgi:hypothetical protein
MGTQMCDVSFYFAEGNVFFIKAIMAFLHSQRVIPDDSGNIDLLEEMLIFIDMLVQPILVGFPNGNILITHAVLP